MMDNIFWNSGKLELWNNGKNIYFSIKTQYSNIPVFHSSKNFSSIPIFRYLASWVVTLMNLLQSLSGHMGIYLSAGDIRMAEHHLDRAKIRPPFQKMAGKGVAKKVGGDPLTKSSLLSIIFKILPEPLSAHPLSRTVDKKGWALLPLRKDSAAFL
jgi:hypothetical protein